MKHDEIHVASLSGKDSKVKVKFCPKCNDPMSETKPFHAIPRLRHDRGVDVNASLAVEVFVCMKCRYLEFYSAERQGAEE
jgi:predicted nucleic-acid-binding Zn-ribbon protein